MPSSPNYGFTNQPILVKRRIILSVIMGDGNHTITTMVDFLVVDQPSAYNIILGRPLMKTTTMVMAVYCLTIKFLTLTRIGYMRSN